MAETRNQERSNRNTIKEEHKMQNKLSRSAIMGIHPQIAHVPARGMPAHAVPQGAQRVAVGQMPWDQTRTGPGGGNYSAAMSSPNSPAYPMLSNVAPLGAPDTFAGPAAVIRQALVPISCISVCEAGGVEKCIQCFPDNGRLYVNGVRAGNGFFEVVLTRITAGGLDNNRLGNTYIDAGIFNSDDMYLPFDGGCVNRDNPISVCFKSFQTPTELPYLNLHFFGTRDQSWNSCEPGLALALNATGQFPMAA
jgi:hypothetical protein